MLESSKLRLEMLLEQQRKEARLEAAARDDEMEETRANAAKKLKSKCNTSTNCHLYLVSSKTTLRVLSRFYIILFMVRLY